MIINTSTVYLNGEFLPLEAAKVSVFDRGFIFGDGIYEYLPVFGRRLFRWQQHLARLEASLRAVRIDNPLTRSQWRDVFDRLIAKNNTDEQAIYIQITRGVAPRDHGFPDNATPTVLVYAQPRTSPPAEQGVSAITAPDIRWNRCDIKSTSLIANVLARQLAVDAGAAEAILLRDGFMTEGAACNIFIVKNGVVVTPPKGPHILPGITRDLAIELMHAHQVPCEERAVPEAELRTAEEILLTSSGKEIVAITQVDGKPIGNGKPGPMYKRVLGLYLDYKRAFREGKAE